MRYKLKTVKELMEEGFEFYASGIFAYGEYELKSSDMYILGTVISEDEFNRDWNDIFVKEILEEDIFEEVNPMTMHTDEIELAKFTHTTGTVIECVKHSKDYIFNISDKGLREIDVH